MNTRYLYIMGTDSGVGKSTVCLGILAQLLAYGYLPQQLAYIKPTTQCVEKQAVAGFCANNNIPFIGIGSLLFRKGFTQDFIDGLTPSSTELLATVLQSILTIGMNKAVVLIDGIGSPSVGSVVGVSNIDIAALLPCRIIFVGKSGIGAAIDDTVLNVSFIQSKHKQNIGLIYNHCPLPDIANTQQYVSKRIVQLLPNITPLGFIARNEEGLESFLQESSEKIAAWFDGYVNKSHLLTDWFALNEPQNITTLPYPFMVVG
ncbi:MAG: AAA family ATPase [Methylococcaceae bacterium]|nr:AAA family ATPase [Methylococcaceae bacterium]